MSVSSTPGQVELKTVLMANGMQTPQSMSDDGSSRGNDDDNEVKPEVEDKKRPRTYSAVVNIFQDSADEVGAQSSEVTDAVFSDAPSQGGLKAKYELSVELPSSRKRSRLATEKTTSADNLTLGSPVDRKIKRSSSGLLTNDTFDEVSLRSSWRFG